MLSAIKPGCGQYVNLNTIGFQAQIFKQKAIIYQAKQALAAVEIFIPFFQHYQI
jgi:hypothetical protein